MSEFHHHTALSHVRQEIDTLQQRVTQQRKRQRRTETALELAREVTTTFVFSPVRSIRNLPSRYILHAIVALIVPIALAFSYLPALPRIEATTPPISSYADTPIELGPLTIDTETDMRIGDPPLPNTDAMPMPISLVSRSEALAPVVVKSQIAFDRVFIRNGPGLDYDTVGILNTDTSLEVIGRHGEWLYVRHNEKGERYWIASELLDIPRSAMYTLFEVPQENIPAPPPPKIATVRESQLNLRDGPGTNYVGMEELQAGVTLSLIEQHDGWMHVATNDFDGWVNIEFLDVDPNILKRVMHTEYIPDPNPALVGSIVDNEVNLRGGPGKVYDTVVTLNTNEVVDLLSYHGDWFKVQANDGTVAWVFSDLLEMSPMARRRVPYTNDIPAEPTPVPVRVAWSDDGGGGGGGGYSVASNSGDDGGGGGGDGGGGGYSAASVPASGDVASYALGFVGYPYVYGGASPASGFDCSGLMQYVYRQYGVYLPRVAASQFSTAYGAAVGSMSNLAPGDLMFFAGTHGPGISHVAMYVGGGRMVHAMMPGLGVGVSNIWDGYWTGHYYGAIRPYR